MSKRNMTNKEFFELMEEVGLTTNESIANIVSYGYRKMGESLLKDGFDLCAEDLHKKADTVYNFLDKEIDLFNH